MADIDDIVRGLTREESTRLPVLSSSWVAGPDLADSVIAHLRRYRELGLVERQFGDRGEPVTREADGGLSFCVRACWWFRLTPLGLEVRARLLSSSGEG